MNARRAIASYRTSVLVCGFAFAITACAVNSRIDHTLALSKVGTEKITDVTLMYGDVRPIHARSLGIAGGSWTMPMTIPESATVKWSTEDGQRHEVSPPIRSKVPMFMSGKIVSFEIHGPKLKVFVDQRLADFKRERTQIYGD